MSEVFKEGNVKIDLDSTSSIPSSSKVFLNPLMRPGRYAGVFYNFGFGLSRPPPHICNERLIYAAFRASSKFYVAKVFVSARVSFFSMVAFYTGHNTFTGP